MPYWNHRILPERLLEEITSCNVDDLITIVKTLIKENSLLTSKINVLLQSLHNQNNLIRYLENIYKRAMQEPYNMFKRLTAISKESYDIFCHIQSLLVEMAALQPGISECTEFAKVSEYFRHSPSSRVNHAVDNHLNFRPNRYYRGAGSEDTNSSISDFRFYKKKFRHNQTSGRRDAARSSRLKNNKTNKSSNIQVPKKCSSEEMTDKSSCSLLNKFLSNKSRRGRPKKNTESPKNVRQPKMSTDVNVNQAKKFYGRQGVKRKSSEEILLDFINRIKKQRSEMSTESVSTHTESSDCFHMKSATVLPDEQGFSSRKRIQRSVKCTESMSASAESPMCFKMRPAVVLLTDVFSDPAYEDNTYVVQYKRANIVNDCEKTDTAVDDVNASSTYVKESDVHNENDFKNDFDDSKLEVPEAVSHQSDEGRAYDSDDDSSTNQLPDDKSRVENNQELYVILSEPSTDVEENNDDDENSDKVGAVINDVVNAVDPTLNGEDPQTPPCPSSSFLVRRGSQTSTLNGEDPQTPPRPSSPFLLRRGPRTPPLPPPPSPPKGPRTPEGEPDCEDPEDEDDYYMNSDYSPKSLCQT